MSQFEIKGINKVRRVPERGYYDRQTVYEIIDQTLICHAGIVQEGQPVVIPTLHARRNDAILLHGATTSRLMSYIKAGHPVCLTMTLVDGIVLARSVFHHSMNYRSVVLFGRGQLIKSAEEKMQALQDFTERLLPGRWDDARRPNDKELKATAVVSVPIDLASAKVRSGPPGDDEEDLSLPVWAGVLPLREQLGLPLPAPDLTEGLPVPDYIQSYIEDRSRRNR